MRYVSLQIRGRKDTTGQQQRARWLGCARGAAKRVGQADTKN